jgi:hypothetical protein
MEGAVRSHHDYWFFVDDEKMDGFSEPRKVVQVRVFGYLYRIQLKPSPEISLAHVSSRTLWDS